MMMTNTLRLLSWNVNGIRAVYRKGFMDWFTAANPHILCLQETRAEPQQIPEDLRQPAGYQAFWNPARSKKGYSGTGLLTRLAPRSVTFGLGVEDFDQEGRTIVADFESFTLVNCYFPNGSRDHSRVPFKLAFYDAFLARCEGLRRSDKPLIFCGDVNTAHREIDLARPRENQNTTGFLPDERAWIDQVVEAGYVDTFRHFHPELPGQYTWWHQVTRARARNIGWRIDYFYIAREGLPHLADAFILSDVMGSDHCPVGIGLEI